MTDVEGTYDDFIASRRSGRRNAIHEIPGAQGAANLSETLAQLNINKSGDEEEDSEKGQDNSAKEEESKGEGS